jgi:transposase
MPILADLVQVVIGVDTHKPTHTAAVLVAATGGVLATQTIPTTAAGYQALLTLAQQHPGRRVWAVEGTGGYGAGLTRLLAASGEWVVELDRPTRPARRHGAKSDPLDAVRAAREALGRPHLAQPRADGQRAALAVLLTARRSAVDASACASSSCRPWWSPPPNGCGPSWMATPPGSWSRPARGYAAIQTGSLSAAPPQRC